jgi:hypothetical protein
MEKPKNKFWEAGYEVGKKEAEMRIAKYLNKWKKESKQNMKNISKILRRLLIKLQEEK